MKTQFPEQKTFLIAILALVFSLQCGLFERKLPPKGEFCDVLVKPPACLEVNFETRKLNWNQVEYELTSKTRTEYYFLYKGEIAELLVSTENRLDIKISGETSPPKFYMRKKEKRSLSQAIKKLFRE